MPAPAPVRDWSAVVAASAHLPDPTPAKREPTYAERVAALRASIIAQKDFYRARAAKILSDHPGRTERTVCFMWSLRIPKGVSAYSGEYHLTPAERESIGADRDKETDCGEECLLARCGTDWLFSLAFDSANGFKYACAGCAALLRRYRIQDLRGAVGN